MIHRENMSAQTEAVSIRREIVEEDAKLWDTFSFMRHRTVTIPKMQYFKLWAGSHSTNKLSKPLSRRHDLCKFLNLKLLIDFLYFLNWSRINEDFNEIKCSCIEIY